MATLKRSFYANALAKVEPMSNRRVRMMRTLAEDEIVRSVGRNQQLSDQEPNWKALHQEAAEALKSFNAKDLKALLSEKFGLRTEEDILSAFARNRARKQGGSFTETVAPAAKSAVPDQDLDDLIEDEEDLEEYE